MSLLPDIFSAWFNARGWTLRPYQEQMLQAYAKRQSTLLIVPTGGGKTLSGFLPSLVDLYTTSHKGLHTLYISPLKALTNDIARNLLQPIEDMGLDINVETRTGDTPSHKRTRQRNKPPHILLTTPESLMLMLSYADAPQIFGAIKSVILDEVHTLASNKRGDFTALALARLATLAPHMIRFGLSATVADPPQLAQWLGASGKPAALLCTKMTLLPDVQILQTKASMPYGGHMARYAMPEVYRHIQDSKTTLVFVNTRAQAELIFQYLWDENRDGLPIALYHGSLNKEQRRKTEAMMTEGKLRAIVATSALELGIDWGDIDLVIQIGAPKGVSRLLQRIGRSNHRMDEPSKALLVPANRFEMLECLAALRAIEQGELDGEPPQEGSLDIIPQYIVNCAASAPITADALYAQITSAEPYAMLTREMFEQLLQFTIDGGYALKAYERFQRLALTDDGYYHIPNRGITQRHRQNIGTIVEAGRLKVKRLRKAHQGRILGEVEERFAQSLSKGDTFLFCGEVLAFEAIVDMTLEAWPAAGGKPKLPTYVGGQMPLSTHLADGVRILLQQHKEKPLDVAQHILEWLDLQEHYSLLPDMAHLLVEQFPYDNMIFSMFYTFDGRKANQTLGMLLTRRMERAGLKPVSFSVTDYALSIASLHSTTEQQMNALFSTDMLGDDLEEWIMDSPMLKRSFRHVAHISGLTAQRYAGARKTMKQVTFSTDLIYDVLRKYDKNHVLLYVTRRDAESQLLDMKRLNDMLVRFSGHIRFIGLERPSPMAIPIIVSERSERVQGSGIEAMLERLSTQEVANAQADAMMNDLRAGKVQK